MTTETTPTLRLKREDAVFVRGLALGGPADAIAQASLQGDGVNRDVARKARNQLMRFADVRSLDFNPSNVNRIRRISKDIGIRIQALPSQRKRQPKRGFAA